uniref:Putative hiv-1 vpr-binding protein n=1 Tax=Ixodes ricinus TaxID=34613 RepID=V5IF54_IXORI
MKLKKNQAAPPKPTKVGGGKPRKLPKPAKTNDDDAVESDTEDYLKVNVTPKAAKVPAAELGSDEDDPELDDEDLDDEDELDEEDSLDDEEGDEDSEGGSDDEVPQLVAAKNKSKPKPAPPKKAGQEESDDEDDEDDEDFDEDDSEDGEDEAPKAKGKPQLKDGGKAAKQPKRKGEEPAEQTSKKQKLGDGIPKSVYMDVDEYDKLFLYIGDLPPGCTAADVKALSPDIVDVRTNVKAGAKLGFMFAKFKSEAIADKNYKRLQGAQLNGQKLRVGYRGAKREGGLPDNWSECHSELAVYGLPEGCPQDKVAKLFPTAVKVATMSFFTWVKFDSKADLLAAVRNESCHKLEGHPLKFAYHFKPKIQKRKKRKSSGSGKKGGDKKFSKSGKFLTGSQSPRSKESPQRNSRSKVDRSLLSKVASNTKLTKRTKVLE